MESFATVNDLEIRWRKLTDQEASRAEVKLFDASNIIRELAGDSYESPDELKVETLKTITCEMVKRAMLSPVDAPALNSKQTGAGPYQETLNYTNPTGDLYLTKAEKKRLGIGVSMIGSIRPSIRTFDGGEADEW